MSSSFLFVVVGVDEFLQDLSRLSYRSRINGTSIIWRKVSLISGITVDSFVSGFYNFANALVEDVVATEVFCNFAIMLFVYSSWSLFCSKVPIHGRRFLLREWKMLLVHAQV
jgi:amino acid permease